LLSLALLSPVAKTGTDREREMPINRVYALNFSGGISPPLRGNIEINQLPPKACAMPPQTLLFYKKLGVFNQINGDNTLISCVFSAVFNRLSLYFPSKTNRISD
jgi:hypothetical protein